MQKCTFYFKILFFFKLFLPFMKNKHVLTILLFVVVLACKDKASVIIPEQDPFKVFPSQIVQHVLLEHFVSESNTESVENSFFIKELELKYGSRLITAALHKQDWLETPYSNELATMLGGMSTYPRGAVNRLPGLHTVFGEDHYTLLHPLNWDYAIERALAEIPELALAVETKVYNGNTGEVKLHIANKSGWSKDMRVGMYLVEDSIQSIFQQGSSEQFLHQHVMKYSLSGVDGDTLQLNSDIADSEIITQRYDPIDLKFYQLNHLYLVAFVFKYDPDFRQMKIYNAVKVKFGGVKFWNE
jgi:hypothetical protein